MKQILKVRVGRRKNDSPQANSRMSKRTTYVYGIYLTDTVIIVK